MSGRPTTPSRTLRAQGYRQAARALEAQPPEDHWGCCDHLPSYGACKAFEEFFRPTEIEQAVYFGGTRLIYWMGDTWTAEHQDLRVLALCFMAAMVEAGDA